jgi:hypothetical protein
MSLSTAVAGINASFFRTQSNGNVAIGHRRQASAVFQGQEGSSGYSDRHRIGPWWWGFTQKLGRFLEYI